MSTLNLPGLSVFGSVLPCVLLGVSASGSSAPYSLLHTLSHLPHTPLHTLLVLSYTPTLCSLTLAHLTPLDTQGTDDRGWVLRSTEDILVLLEDMGLNLQVGFLSVSIGYRACREVVSWLCLPSIRFLGHQHYVLPRVSP